MKAAERGKGTLEAKKLAVEHAMMGKMRSYWQHWKQKTEQRAMMEEFHDEGPRRLEYLKVGRMLLACSGWCRKARE